MQPLILALLLGLTVKGQCVKLVQLQVPKLVDPREGKVVLKCNYELDSNEGLFSVSWIKEDAEFFRYMPSTIAGRPPSVDTFNVPEVRVSVAESNDRHVVLQQREKDNLSGSYACQVTGEGPKFDIKFDMANVSVGVLPQRDPALEGLRSHYDLGDVLTAECISAPSYPPAQLTFLLNNLQVKKELTQQLPTEGHVEDSIVATTRLMLSLPLERHDFNASGSLSVVCRSMLPGVPGANTRETSSTVYLTASNEKLAQEAPTKLASAATTAGVAILINCHLILVAAFITLLP